MKHTTKEIENALDDLKAAMLESVKASEAEVEIKQRVNKARYNLLQARDTVRSITFN